MNDYTDQEINAVADWWASLSLREIFLLKELYETYLLKQAEIAGNTYVH